MSTWKKYMLLGLIPGTALQVLSDAPAVRILGLACPLLGLLLGRWVQARRDRRQHGG